jgi:hypothetical protein
MTRHRALSKDRVLAHRAPVGTNACGVFAYYSRAQARARDAARPDLAARRRPMLCKDCGLWHNRRLPTEVIAGLVTAAEWYGEDGHPPYGEIIIAASELLRSAGIYQVKFHRGHDESWGMTARATGADLAVHGYADPVAAAQAMHAQVGQVRARFAEELGTAA